MPTEVGIHAFPCCNKSKAWIPGRSLSSAGFQPDPWARHDVVGSKESIILRPGIRKLQTLRAESIYTRQRND